MQDHAGHSEGDASSLPAHEIVAACSEFERAWRRQEGPCIEDYLERVPADSRAILLQALIALEMDLRRAAGESIDPQEYRVRFPRHADQVATAVEHHPPQSMPAAALDETEEGVELVRLVDGYLADLQQGKTPDRAALLATHPSFASQLEACLASIDLVHGAARDEALPRSIGRYTVQGTLGRGAFGVVYLARERSWIVSWP